MKGIKAGVEACMHERGGVAWLDFPAFADPEAVLHAVSTRRGGVSGEPAEGLNFSYRVGDREDRVRENRGLLSRALGVDFSKLTTVHQVHGDAVVCVAAGDAGKGAEDDPVSDADALMTNLPGIPLFIQTADCLPVFLYDPVRKVAALAHAGWRGTLAGIAAKTAHKMEDHYGCRPADVKAAFGPCIGVCCFEVDGELRGKFLAAYPWGEEVFRAGFHGKWHLDLEEANARQLVETGLAAENLVRPGLCTVENLKMFYSHRVENGKTGRNASVIMLR